MFCFLVFGLLSCLMLFLICAQKVKKVKSVAVPEVYASCFWDSWKLFACDSREVPKGYS
ncbi:putative lipoprotein [Chlamydia avium]|uniref:Lipoprotein n=1 Tax=Chlamydia avium TaxID=1457141 RepID=A0ABP2X5W4_9CHLA|nr:putative lipoprotein [Chlamydia avium]